MGSRRVGDGVVVVLGGSVIHAGALEVVSRAHGVLLLQCGTTQRVSLLSQSNKGWRPGARVTILDVATGCEHLANGRTHVVCYAEAPEQLEIHLWIGESANPSCRTGHPVWIGGFGHVFARAAEGMPLYDTADPIAA